MITDEKETSISGVLSEQAEDVNSSFTDIETLTTSETNVVAKAKRFGRWWLLKGLRKERAEETTYQQRLQKEFEILMQLQHPYVVSAVGMETVDGLGRCIVMEYVDGVTLRAWLNGKTTRQARQEVARQLMDAVGYIHLQGIVHRDLKPGNILMTKNGGHVKLIDFGLADKDSYAILKQPAGTPRYMSPEQLQTVEADVRNDIYSIGVILQQMDLGAGYRRMIKKCLLPIEQRYQNMAELQKDMQAAAGRKRRLTILAVGALAAILLVLTGVLTWRAKGQEQEIVQLKTAAQKQQQAQQAQETAQQQMADTLAELRAYNQLQEEKEITHQNRRQDVKAAIEKGYRIVDKAMQQTHIDEHLDTLTDFRYIWPDFTSRSQAGLRAAEAYASKLRPSFNETEKAEITNALNEHIGERVKKWNQKIIDIAK